MAKVMTSEGGILSTQVIVDKPRKVPGAAAPLEMKAGNGSSPPVVDGPGERAEAEAKPETKPEVKADEPAIDAEDHDLPERARKRIGKYSVAAKQEAALRAKAEAEAAESERFAEQLFNEREQWRKKAEELESKVGKEQPKPAESLAPDENDPKYRNAAGEFEWKRFSTDNAAYEAKKAIAEDRKAQADAQAKAAQAAADAEFAKKIQAATKKYPDWREVVTNSPVVLPNEALAYLQQSDYGTDLAYYLATNPDDAAKIKALHPIRAIAALRDIETTRFEKPAVSAESIAATPNTVERQGAPAPITPISTSGAGSINVDPAKMDFKQLREYERERRKRR